MVLVLLGVMSQSAVVNLFFPSLKHLLLHKTVLVKVYPMAVFHYWDYIVYRNQTVSNSCYNNCIRVLFHSKLKLKFILFIQKVQNFK